MKAEQVIKFLSTLGVKDAMPGNKWVTAKCPLAPFTHKSGKDSTPSFGVYLESGNFNCFACQSGSLEKLIGALELYISQNPGKGWENVYHLKQAREVLEGIEDIVEPLPEYTEFQNPGEVFQAWPEWFLEQFPSAVESDAAMQYLKGRGLDGVVVHQFDLRWDVGWRRIVAPFWNVHGKLAGARGRAIDPEAKVQHFDYKWNDVNNSGLVFYNEQAIEKALEAGKPVCLVEGQFDCIKVAQYYPYTVGNLTAKPTLQKLQKLRNCVYGVLTMLDNDQPGKEATKLWIHGKEGSYSGLHGYVPVGTVEYPEEFKDPDKMPGYIIKSLFEGI